MKFIIKGSFRMGRNYSKFEKEVTADNENHAKEMLYASLGSNHKVKRRFIIIEEIKNA